MQWMESSNKVFPESDLEELAEKENALEDAQDPKVPPKTVSFCAICLVDLQTCVSAYMSCAHIYKTIHDLSL
jgi:hypothetical protein